MFDIYQDIFDRRDKSPLWWFDKSSDLHASAGALWCSMKDDKEIKNTLGFSDGFSLKVACWPVYQMLFGMAFELVIKAIAVVNNDKVVPSHKLQELVLKSGIDLTKDEKDVLTLLTESIVWKGRYPTPKKKSYLEDHYKKASEVLYDEKKFGSLNIKTPNNKLDWEYLDGLYKKFSSRFFKLYNS